MSNINNLRVWHLVCNILGHEHEPIDKTDTLQTRYHLRVIRLHCQTAVRLACRCQSSPWIDPGNIMKTLRDLRRTLRYSPAVVINEREVHTLDTVRAGALAAVANVPTGCQREHSSHHTCTPAALAYQRRGSVILNVNARLSFATMHAPLLPPRTVERAAMVLILRSLQWQQSREMREKGISL
jgi:hypothetical protein